MLCSHDLLHNNPSCGAFAVAQAERGPFRKSLGNTQENFKVVE
jgi:hypothetical protein